MKKILVTGGCGYKGSILIPKLLDKGYYVVCLDTQWFGSHLEKNKNLEIIKSDIRNIDSINLENVDSIIHLANVANDPAVELNPTMSWEINVLAGQQLIDKAVRENVKHFIFASSGSVYGVKSEDRVTEELSLVPISTYNKTKMVAERVFMSYSDKLKVHCIRPATVCGISPRMRLDVAVNLLTFQALSRNQITVLGGTQVRPNIHIDDITDLYLHLLSNMHSVASGFYNAGFENISILDIAEMIRTKTNCEINIEKSNDPRSYRQDSSKILETGFVPKKKVSNAIDEIIEAYKNKILKDTPQSHTVDWMKKNNIK
ncbi:SDR family oxidoreductase [Prochlorococcus sp. AH-736-M13]|nr:SDR family oxidoreductase [Prochlorococcus sp. AH-736-M13]MDA9746845.1 SDR family oxidoreductase [Prochlorococcus sp. AH-736-M13]